MMESAGLFGYRDRKGVSAMFNRILLPVDTAEPELARPALAHAADLARSSGALIRLIHVRPFMVDAALEYLPQHYFDEEERQAVSELQALARDMGLDGAQVSCASPVGTIYDHVIAAATEFNADLIVIGSHRPAMSTYLIGSNAARIVRHAKCSVLVVR